MLKILVENSDKIVLPTGSSLVTCCRSLWRFGSTQILRNSIRFASCALWNLITNMPWSQALKHIFCGNAGIVWDLDLPSQKYWCHKFALGCLKQMGQLNRKKWSWPWRWSWSYWAMWRLKLEELVLGIGRYFLCWGRIYDWILKIGEGIWNLLGRLGRKKKAFEQMSVCKGCLLTDDNLTWWH